MPTKMKRAGFAFSVWHLLEFSWVTVNDPCEYSSTSEFYQSLFIKQFYLKSLQLYSIVTRLNFP